MVDTKTPGDKTLSVPSKTLSLKPRVETGTVRQSFSHGRSKQVVVEVKKRRIGGDGKPEPAPAPQPVAPAAPPPKRPGPAAAPSRSAGPATAPAAAPKSSGVVLRTLTDEERERRAHALGDARLREAEERKIAEEEAKIRAQRDAAEKAERDAAEARKREEDDRRKHDEVTKKKADEVAKKRFGEPDPAAATTAVAAKAPATTARPGAAARPGTPPRPGTRPALEAEEEEAPKFRRGPGGAMRPAAPPQRPTRAAKTATERPRGRLTLVNALNDDVRERSTASFHRREQRRHKAMMGNEPREKISREVTIPEAITIQELANRMSERSVEIIKILMKQGQMATINDVIDADTAQLIAEELGHTVKRVAEADEVVLAAGEDERRFLEGRLVLGLLAQLVVLRQLLHRVLVSQFGSGRGELEEVTGCVVALHHGDGRVVVGLVPDLGDGVVIASQHRLLRRLTGIGVRDEHRREQAQPEHLLATAVRDSAGDHPAERVTEDGERCVTDLLVDEREHTLDDVVGARCVTDRGAAEARQIGVETTPARRRDVLARRTRGEGRLQRQHEPVVGVEAVKQHDGGTGAVFDEVHATSLETRGSGEQRTANSEQRTAKDHAAQDE